MRLAPGPIGMLHSREMLEAGWGEGREVGSLYQSDSAGGCLHITAQSGRVPKIRSQSCLGFGEVGCVGGNSLSNYLSSAFLSDFSEWRKTCPVAKNWHTRVWHTPHASPPTHNVLLSPPPPPILILPSSSGALPQRSPLNHMCQCRACSCSGANCSLVNSIACWWGSPLHPETHGYKAGWWRWWWLWVGGTDRDLSMQFISPV